MIKKKENYLDSYSSTLNYLVKKQNSNFDILCKKINTLSKTSRIIICGNGGSSSIASHVAVDISKVLGRTAITFADDNLITCYANDYGYANWTSEALKVYSNPNDLVILISSSGKSQNLINAAKYVKKNKIKLITLTGFNKNNPLSKLGDLNIWVDSESYNLVEMTHHILLVAAIDRLSILKNDN
tara:strand:- start:274 stop:828 length:555 start_codon:yes stop_codon:yes gene_type:complete